MSYRERLIDRAEDCLEDGQPIPLDLAAKLMGEGVIVEELERKFTARSPVLI